VWGPEWREPDLAQEAPFNSALPAAAPNSHWPVLIPVASDDCTDEVGLVCRRAVQTFRWTIEAHRLRGHPDGTIWWSGAETVSMSDGSDRDRAGANMPVAWAGSPDGRVFGAWQRHDRGRAAPGFHFTMGSSAIVVAPLESSPMMRP
jgi:hypothetical protein